MCHASCQSPVRGCVGSGCPIGGSGIFSFQQNGLPRWLRNNSKPRPGAGLTIGGEIGLSLYPVLGATAQDIAIGNPDWAGGGEMLRADEMDIGVNLMRLISGTVAVERVVLQSPVVEFRRAADGRATWDFRAPEADETPAASTSEAPTLTLARAEIHDGRLRYIDEQGGMDFRVMDLDATLSLPAMDGPLSLEASAQLKTDSQFRWHCKPGLRGIC